ncbi:hypothetical protein LA080_009675 [Diaporthe eres]|nr:hypothetical protein LA080_009675 [Diaporthe eres]
MIAEEYKIIRGDQFPSATYPHNVRKKDSLGWAYKHQKTWAYIELALEGKAGWVPLSIIQAGAAKVDKDKIPMVIPTTSSAAVANLPLQPALQNLLQTTLSELWRAISASKEAILEPIQYTDVTSVEQTVFGPHAHLFARAFYACLVPPALDIMKDGVFNTRELLGRVPSVNSKDHSRAAGCYIWLYGDIKENKLKFILKDETITDATYTGQSLDMVPRKISHEACLSGQSTKHSKSNHYRIGRGAQKRAMLPLLFVNYEDDSVKKVLNLFGLLKVLVFDVVISTWW